MSKLRRLDEVATVIMGQAPPGESYNNDGNGWPLIAGAGDFHNGRAATKKYTTVGTKLSRSGDIVLSIRASIGDKITADGEYCLGRGVAAIRAGSYVNPRFLWHWLTGIKAELAYKGKGATFKQVNRSDIGDLLIPLLSPEEQQKIAAVLDQADGLRAKRRQAVALLDDLAKSIFFDMFGNPATNPKGWPICTIGDLIESASYGTSQKAADVGDLPVLRMGNITSVGRIDLTDLKYMQSNTMSERYLVRPGDLLFNRTNSADLVGKTAVYRDGPPLAFAGYLVRVRTNSSSHPEYLSAFLNSAYGKRILRGMCKSIIGMANINARELQTIRIPDPPFNLQEEFGDRFQEVERYRSAHAAHLAGLDELFGSLQAKAFRGEL